jgi:hypothetical protein
VDTITRAGRYLQAHGRLIDRYRFEALFDKGPAKRVLDVRGVPLMITSNPLSFLLSSCSWVSAMAMTVRLPIITSAQVITLRGLRVAARAPAPQERESRAA